MHQVAAAEVGHLEVDVAEVEAGQIGAAEIKTLKTKKTKRLNCLPKVTGRSSADRT